jgi:hypothetical protein
LAFKDGKLSFKAHQAIGLDDDFLEFSGLSRAADLSTGDVEDDAFKALHACVGGQFIQDGKRGQDSVFEMHDPLHARCRLTTALDV